MKNNFTLGLLCLLVTIKIAAAEPSTTLKTEIISMRPIIVRATVDNNGTRPAFIMPYNFFTTHGWQAKTEGADGKYTPLYPPGVMIPLMPDQFVEIEAGKSFTQDYNLSSWGRWTDANGAKNFQLGDIKGRYKFSLSYSFNPARIDETKLLGEIASETEASQENKILNAWQKMLEKGDFITDLKVNDLFFTID